MNSSVTCNAWAAGVDGLVLTLSAELIGVEHTCQSGLAFAGSISLHFGN